MHSIEITKDTCTLWQDGIKVVSVPLPDFVAVTQAQAEQAPPLDLIPNGVRFFRRRGDAVAIVTEQMPRLIGPLAADHRRENDDTLLALHDATPHRRSGDAGHQPGDSYLPTLAPITSPETMISTLRFR